MSSYRLIPTFRFARRIAQDIHPYPMKSMFSKHWKQMMDHHLGMMEKVFDPSFGAKWADGANAPTWWKCAVDSTQQSPSKRQFGKIEFGQDVKKFELVLDLGEQYNAEEMKVNVKLVNDNELHVEARQESGSAESGEYRKQFFSKVLSLPLEADVEALKSTLSEDGMLKVEAPMMAVKESQPPVREIPIETSKSASSPVEESASSESKVDDPTKGNPNKE